MQTHKIFQIQFTKLFFLHPWFQFNWTHLLKQVSNMWWDSIFLWYWKRNSCQFFNELFLAAAFPRCDSNHQFIVHDSDCKNITFWWVKVFEKWLDWHIEWSSNVLFGSDLLITDNRETKICNFPYLISSQDIGRLQITMNDAHLHEILDSFYDLGHDWACNVFS